MVGPDDDQTQRLVSRRVALLKPWDDRHEFWAATFLCFFNQTEAIPVFQGGEHRRTIKFRDMEVPVYAGQIQKYAPDGLAICIPTLFGTLESSELDTLRVYIRSFSSYYERTHDLRNLFIYSDNETLVGGVSRASPLLSTVYLDEWDGKSWYHGQKLAMQDCWMRALILNSAWIAFIDLDEILTWPYSPNITWEHVFAGLDAVSFPSNDASLQLLPGDDSRRAGERNVTFRLHSIAGVNTAETFASLRFNSSFVRSSPSCRLSCVFGQENRRKYAISGNIFSGYGPERIHGFHPYYTVLSNNSLMGTSSVTVSHRTAHLDREASGIFLKHFRGTMNLLAMRGLGRYGENFTDGDLERVFFNANIDLHSVALPNVDKKFRNYCTDHMQCAYPVQ